MRVSLRMVAVLAAALLLSGRPAIAAEYPSQPVRVIVPFSQGGSSSVTARYFQKAIQDAKLLNGNPMPIMYMPGAGGTVGARYVKDAAPDGYTILLWHVAVCGAQAMGNVDFGSADFVPVAATGSQGYFLTVREDSPYGDARSLLKTAQEKPETVTAAVNLGAASHIGLVLVEQAAPGLKFRFVQTGSTSEIYTSLLGGHVEAGLVSVPALKQVASKGVRPLAILSKQRDPEFPDVPTLAELGYDVEFAMVNWWFAPKGTPAERVAVLADNFKQAMQGGYIQKSFETSSISMDFLSGKSLDDFIGKQCRRIGTMGKRLRGEE